MKKLALVLICVALLGLCACNDESTIDNNTTSTATNNNSNTNSNTSSVISDFDLPERDDPTVSSSTGSSSGNNQITSHDPDDTPDDLTVTKNLTLEVEMPSYSSTVKTINLILQNSNGKFNYYTDFFLQRYENGKWEYYTTKNDTIDYKFDVSYSESNIQFIIYNVSKLYNHPLPTGTYRFIQESDIGKMVSNSFEIVDNIIEQPQQ